MRTVFATVRDVARAQLWPLPVLAVASAVAGGIFLPRLDAHVDDSVPSWLDGVLFGGDAGAASTLLDAISTSLITVTSLTFSLTVVTLQLASSQFSPRLLRTFTSDVFVQSTLAVFLATFSFSLTTLRAVRSSDDGEGGFVPRISITLAFVLAAVSVVGLVLFLAHLARQIRVETMLRDVHDDATETIGAATRPASDAAAVPWPEPPEDAVVLTAPSSGFLTGIDDAELLRRAGQHHLVVRIDRFPGSSVVAGTPIGFAWSQSGRLGDDAAEALRHAVKRSVRIGYERTAAQDVGYGLRQLTDVANKALSPGINDPTTAVHALGHISALLCDLVERDLSPVVRSDDDGHIRLALARPSFPMLLDDAIAQPRRYGSTDFQVLRRIHELLGEVAWRSDSSSEIRAAVAEQLGRLRATVADGNFDAQERSRLDAEGRRVEHALTRDAARVLR